jgi:hypothetical protein
VGALDEPTHTAAGQECYERRAYAHTGLSVCSCRRRRANARGSSTRLGYGDGLEADWETYSPVAEPVGLFNAPFTALSISDNGGPRPFRSGSQAVMWATDRPARLARSQRRVVERIGGPIPIADVALSPDQKRAAVSGWPTTSEW